jgi:CTP:molybdopterin cytidylyltransferase MocA
MIYAVVLSAGASSRMGGKPKALLRDSRNLTYLSRVAGTAREGGAGGVIVVVAHPHADAIKKALPPGAAAVVNPLPDRGMLSSVQSGINAVPTQCTGVLVWPVDIPFVKASTVRALIEARPGRVALPRYQGKGGHPVRIPRPLFADVMSLEGDAGLKGLFDLRPNLVERIDVDDPSVLVDIDTPADASAAEERAFGPPPPQATKKK